jgi:lipopolysaccharide export system permease protein
LVRILDRYILRQVFLTWFAITGGLLVVLLTHQLARVLERAAASRFPQSVIFELIWLSVLQYIPIFVPIGLILGIVLALGRLYHDSEIAAALACGVGPTALFRPVTIMAGILTLVLAGLSLHIGPNALSRALALRSKAFQEGQFAPITAGRFRTFAGASAVVYAEDVRAGGTLVNVFVERQSKGVFRVALAREARHTTSADGKVHTITLFDGEQLEGVPGSQRFRIMRFMQTKIPIPVPQGLDEVVNLKGVPTPALINSNEPEKQAELHWRLGIPVMCIVLTCIAVPLSRLRPREGRYARVVYAVVIYFIYIQLLSAGKVWIARGTTPGWLGLWWIHAMMFTLAVTIAIGPRWAQRARYRDVKRAVLHEPAR